MTTQPRSRLAAGFAALVAVALAASPASADTLALFGTPPTAGIVGYVGGASPFFGGGISLDGLVSDGTPANSGTLATCVNCQLGFVTGNFLLGDATAWSFGHGGSFAVTGGVDLTGNAALGDPGDIEQTVLFSGSFRKAPLSPFVGVAGGTNPFVGVVLAYFKASLDPALAAHFGEPTSARGLLTFHFNAEGAAPGAFVSREVTDVTLIASVPEPATVMLLATGLLCLVRRGARRD